jgi:hypothetical protein
MLRKLLLASAAAALAVPFSIPASAHAGIFVGVRVVEPGYYRPGPVVVYQPAPVVVAQPAPVVVTEPAPGVITQPPPLVSPAPVIAPAPPPVVVVPRPWHVQYRFRLGEPWREYAAYRYHARAMDARDFLVHRGYRVRVVHY